jgi:flagellar hook-length control protein FliK
MICRLFYRELFMNKSVLPISLDSVSFDSASVSKSARKARVDSGDISNTNNFAERLSQSQQEIAKQSRVKSRPTDNCRSQSKSKDKNIADEKVKDPAANQQRVSNKTHLHREVANDKKTAQQELKDKNADGLPEGTSQSVSQTSEDPALSQESLTTQQEYEENYSDTALVPPVSSESVSVSDFVNETKLHQNLESAILGEDKNSDVDLLADEPLNIDSSSDSALTETDGELLMKGVDAKTFTENYLNGIDAGSDQEIQAVQSASLEVSSASDPLQEAGFDSADGLLNASLLSYTKPQEVLSSSFSNFTSISSSDETVTNGKDLPLEWVSSSSEENSGIDLGVLIESSGEIKADEKSVKNDLFRSLLSQAQNDKALEFEKPAALSTSANVTSANITSVSTAATASPHRLFVPQTQLGMNVAHPHWGNAVGEKILWMANQQLSSADIRLDPPELGSLQVRVTVQQDQANISFITPHPQVRELLDQQVNRLREMFAEQGLQLGQVDIADRHQQESRQSQDESQAKGRFVSDESEDAQVMSVSSLYLVDQFV